jgi:AcrR family transcriptional regulator
MPKIVDHDERREYLAGISAELIAEHGLERATIREIAARTGFSRGVIEHYFDDKDHLITMAVVWVNDRYVRREQAMTRGKEGLEALEARLSCVMPLSKEPIQEWKIRLRFWSLASYHTDLQKMMATRLRLSRERFLRDLKTAVELGEVDKNIDAQMTANWLVHLVSGACSHAMIAPSYYSKRYLKGMIVDIIADLRSGGGKMLLNVGR